MQLVVVAAAFILSAFGFSRGGIIGALTGLVAAVGVGSGLAILGAAEGTEVADSGAVRRGQRIGGVVAAIMCLIGAVYGGWRWGWAWALGGYAVGMLSAAILGLRRSSGVSNVPAQPTAERNPEFTTARLPLFSFEEFLSRTAQGRANQMNMREYENHPFECACGEIHSYSADTVPVLRELSGMRLVVACPAADFVTCVKVKGVLRFDGFDSLFGAAVPPDQV